MRRRALLTTLGAVVPVGLAGCSQLRPDGTDATPEGDDPTATDPTATDSTVTTPTAPSSTPATSTVTTPGAMTLAEHELVRERTGTPDELVRIDGVARNDGDAPLESLTAVAEFRDGSGAFIDAVSAELDELGAGKKWQFSLVYPGSGEATRAVENYRLRIEVGE